MTALGLLSAPLVRTFDLDGSQRIATLRGAAARMGLELHSLSGGAYRLMRSGLSRTFDHVDAVEAFIRAVS